MGPLGAEMQSPGLSASMLSTRQRDSQLHRIVPASDTPSSPWLSPKYSSFFKTQPQSFSITITDGSTRDLRGWGLHISFMAITPTEGACHVVRNQQINIEWTNEWRNSWMSPLFPYYLDLLWHLPHWIACSGVHVVWNCEPTDCGDHPLFIALMPGPLSVSHIVGAQWTLED